MKKTFSKDAFNTIGAIDTQPFNDTLIPNSAYNFNSTINVIKHNKTSSRLLKTPNMSASVDIKVPTASDIVDIENRPSRETNKLSKSQKVTD